MRGDAIWLDFDPQAGHEQAGRRPALVLSPESYNGLVGFALVCPITNKRKGYPFEVVIPDGVNVTGTILADQVRSLDWKIRRAEFIVRLPDNVVREAKWQRPGRYSILSTYFITAVISRMESDGLCRFVRFSDLPTISRFALEQALTMTHLPLSVRHQCYSGLSCIDPHAPDWMNAAQKKRWRVRGLTSIASCTRRSPSVRPSPARSRRSSAGVTPDTFTTAEYTHASRSRFPVGGPDTQLLMSERDSHN
ncbi:MAG: type II toxin-antitoxin system PemK/MazF family toxin [Blastocatellia bacterium]|nr:type II toxin-antitoxin system PemK/MazF family toxin [Blastocatellia bacterium]